MSSSYLEVTVLVRTICLKFLTREILKKLKFLAIHQNFPYQIFLLATANVAPATVSSIFYLSSFFTMPICQYPPLQRFVLYGILGSFEVWQILIQMTIFTKWAYT